MLSLRKTVDIRQFQTRADEKKVFNQKVKECELKLTMLLVEHNLPMLLMDHLSKLLVSAAPDSNILKAINYASTKTTILFKNFKAIREESIQKILKDTKYSIIIDETTDISVKKMLGNPR